MHSWEWPDRPWARIHIDYAGQVKGRMILVIVDSHSKWIEAHVVSSATSQATIEKLRLVFSIHGIPEVIISDNGTAFTSQEFTEFVRSNGIKHLTSAPYHPAGWLRGPSRHSRTLSRRSLVELVSKLRSRVSFSVTASPLTPRLV